MTLIDKPFMTRTCRIFAGPLLAMGLVLGAPVAAQDTEGDLGVFKKWQSHWYQEAGAKVCNMFSEPTKHYEAGKPRGKIYVYVTHRSSIKRFHEVSFDMGYPLKKGSEVTVKIGKKKFNLFTKNGSAFAYKDDDKPLVKAMRAGSSMIVEGVSAKGTKTKDTYSLSGFSKAHNKINKSCGTKKP